MNRRERIEESMAQRFGLQHLEVMDESHGHSVPDGSESHFKIVAVSEEFEGKRLIQRHRMINELLESEFAGGMHALAIHVYTADEWHARFNEAPMSPPCAGGSTRDGETD